MPDRAPGVLVVSLDFELFWGVRGMAGESAYRPHIAGAPRAARSILGALSEAGVHATWAAVGCVFARDRRELEDVLPTFRPAYPDSRLSTYAYLEETPHLDPDTHFAPDMVEAIARTPGQEVASHSFSHFYTLEPGQTEAHFTADLEAAARLAERRGVRLRTFVFPRNQCNPEYLPVLKRFGFTSYRGTEPQWAYRERSGTDGKPWRRAYRLLDAYFPLSGSQTYSREACRGGPLLNLRASRFLGPVRPGLRKLEPLRLRRITRSLDRAAARGEIVHLWWHPHNFGVRLEENMAFLQSVLDHYRTLRRSQGMLSLNMGELADTLHARHG